MKVLYNNQENHVSRIVDILNRYGRALDNSETGSGKTLTSIRIFEKMLKLYPKLNLLIIAPPTLCEMWKEYIQNESETPIKKITFISTGIIFKKQTLRSINSLNDTFIIVDESHFFKNDSSQRSIALLKIIKYAKFALLLSATPIDTSEQIMFLKSILKCNTSLLSYTSKMYVEFNHTCAINLQHSIDMPKMLVDEYKRGYRSVSTAKQINEHENTIRFIPGKFQNGIKQIHDSLFQNLLETIDNRKTIVVLKYNDHFEDLLEKFPHALILNGKLPINERLEVIKKFQQNDLEYPLIAINISIGGVGIELDDKHGGFPRHIITLPTTSGTEFLQLIGRVLRLNTKSNSKVTVIQPDFVQTYFLKQLTRKLPVMKKFSTIPDIQHTINKHHDSCSINCLYIVKKKFNLYDDITIHISKFICTCIDKYNNDTSLNF